MQRTIESKHVVNHLELLITNQCPPDLAHQIKELIINSGLTWFANNTRDEFSNSRREVFITPINSLQSVVVKKKDRLEDDNGLKVSYFTQSIVHEFRTANLMRNLIGKINLPQFIEHDGKKYSLIYDVEIPVAAIINLENPNDRYSIFAYIPGDSVRKEVAMNGGWSYTPENKRKLFGQMHKTLNQVAKELVEHGLEPWDLGVHQIVYRIDEQKQEIHLGIIDTEEYNLSCMYGAHWPEIFISQGLPAILPFL